MIASLQRLRKEVEGVSFSSERLADRILESNSLEDGTVWRVFEVEGGGETSLAACDSSAWMEALFELSERGLMPRDRLIDETLSTLERDFSQYRAGWFSRFHERLKPSLDEKVTRTDRYLTLLGSAIPPTVKLALKVLMEVDKAGQLSGRELLEHLGPALQSRVKSTVLLAFRLLKNAAKREPDIRFVVASIAVQALIHESADVQSATLDLVEALQGDADNEAIAEELAQYADGISPSLKSRFNSMARLDAEPESETDVEDSLAEGADNLYQAERVHPIETIEELVVSFLSILDDSKDPIEIERVIDGVGRLGANKPDNFDKLSGALAKKAKVGAEANYWDNWLERQIAIFALGFCNGESRTHDIPESYYCNAEIEGHESRNRGAEPIRDLFLHRISMVLQSNSQGVSVNLLSVPDFTDGLIDPTKLVAKLKNALAKNQIPDERDFCLSLMRLSTQDRDQAFVNIGKEPGEYMAALSFALGADIPMGNTCSFWLAALAGRVPYSDSPAFVERHGNLGPDAGKRSQFSIENWVVEFGEGYRYTEIRMSVTPSPNEYTPSVNLPLHNHLAIAGATGLSTMDCVPGLIRWRATLWPLNYEPFFAQGVLIVGENGILSNPPDIPFLEPLLNPRVPFGEMGTALISLALAATDPAVIGVALEIVIMGIDDGRLKLDTMSRFMAQFYPSGKAPAGRWTKAFKELAAVSPKHKEFVRNLIAGMLRHDPVDAPREIGGMIELLYELHVEAGSPLTDSEAREYFEAVRKGGKFGKFSRKVLELE